MGDGEVGGGDVGDAGAGGTDVGEAEAGGGKAISPVAGAFSPEGDEQPDDYDKSKERSKESRRAAVNPRNGGPEATRQSDSRKAGNTGRTSSGLICGGKPSRPALKHRGKYTGVGPTGPRPNGPGGRVREGRRGLLGVRGLYCGHRRRFARRMFVTRRIKCTQEVALWASPPGSIRVSARHRGANKRGY